MYFTICSRRKLCVFTPVFLILVIYQRKIIGDRNRGGRGGHGGTQPNGLACKKLEVVFLKVLQHNWNSSFCKKTLKLYFFKSVKQVSTSYNKSIVCFFTLGYKIKHREVSRLQIYTGFSS